MMIEHRSPFGELAVGHHPLEFGLVDKMIVAAFDLAGPLRPRRRTDRYGDVRIGLKQHSADRRLARARWRREHDKEAAAAAMLGSAGRIGHGRTCLGLCRS